MNKSKLKAIINEMCTEEIQMTKFSRIKESAGELIQAIDLFGDLNHVHTSAPNKSCLCSENCKRLDISNFGTRRTCHFS